jgi:hypothetical protein
MPLSVTGTEKHAKAAELNKAKSKYRNFAVFPQQSFMTKKEDLTPPPWLPESIFQYGPAQALKTENRDTHKTNEISKWAGSHGRYERDPQV